MKTLIFIDNDLPKKADENRGHAYHMLKGYGNLKIKVTDLKLIPEFHKKESELQDQMLDNSNVVVTWSMFTENHFGSYDQLCDLMVMGGLTEMKDKIYINTSTYLKYALGRGMEHYNQGIYIAKCIQNNFIIHYDEKESAFFRLKIDLNSDDFTTNETIDLNLLLQ